MRAITLILLLCAAIAQSQISKQNFAAFLASGNITDFGYSYTVNAGRVAMERNLNITGSRYVPNIEDYPTALATITGLVAEGFKLIVTTTSLHGNASLMSASRYPNVTFVHTGNGAPPLPNYCTLSFSGPDMFYAAGTFCGAMTKNNRVGFIHPGAPVASYATLNSFYVGVKDANPDAEVYVVFTNTYLDPDRTRGASNILLNQTGVDQLAGQQDDMTLQEEAMSMGLLGVGISGFSQRSIYGESIGMSVIKDWGGPFTDLAKKVMNASNYGLVFGGQMISAAFKSGYTTLDTPSYLVSDDAWAKVRAAAIALRNTTKPYYCSPWVSYLGVGATGCLTNTTTFSVAPLTAIKNRGTYTVPLTEVSFPKGTAVGLIILAALLWLFVCCISAALFYLRRDTVMLASSPLFLGLVLFGCSATFSSVIAWVSDPNAASCTARIWLPSIGCTLCMGAMIIKNVRLWLIFDAALRKIKIRDLRLLGWTGVLLAADIVLLAIWTGLGDPRVNIEQGRDGLSTYEIRKTCVTSQIGDEVLYAIIGLHLAQLAVGCFVTFKIRVIDIEEFNESRPFGLCIYIVSLVFTIGGILIGTSGTTNVQLVIIVSLCLLIASGAVLFVLFVPKFLTIFVKGNRPIEKFMNSMRQKGGSSSTASATQASSPAQNNKSVQLQEI